MSYLWSRTTPKSEFLFFCPAPPLAALAGLIQRREVSIAVHRRQFGGSIFRLAATKALCCTAFVWAASYDLFCFRLVIKPIDLSPIFLGHFRGQQSSAAGNFRIDLLILTLILLADFCQVENRDVYPVRAFAPLLRARRYFDLARRSAPFHKVLFNDGLRDSQNAIAPVAASIIGGAKVYYARAFLKAPNNGVLGALQHKRDLCDG